MKPKRLLPRKLIVACEVCGRTRYASARQVVEDALSVCPECVLVGGIGIAKRLRRLKDGKATKLVPKNCGT